jgi:hypothetical protein
MLRLHRIPLSLSASQHFLSAHKFIFYGEKSMLDKLKSLAGKAKDTLSSTAVLVGDLNGDGKVDEQDARIAAEWAKKTATSIGDEASRLGKEAMRSDLAKDAASGAAIGAVVAIPVPIIGPMAGAAIGAVLGVYKNVTNPNQSVPKVIDRVVTKDIHAELLKLDDLRQKNIISEAEFEIQKKKILDTST